MIQFILHQSPGNDWENQAQNQIKHAAVAGWHIPVLLRDINLLPLLVSPVQAINIAGDNRQKICNNTRGSLYIGCCLRVLSQSYKPVDAIDATSDQ